MATTRSTAIGRRKTEVNHKKRASFGRLGKHLALICFGVIMLYPLAWMVSSSLKPTELIFSEPGLWPSRASLNNYVEGWTALQSPFTRFFANSFIVVIGAIIGNLVSCSLAAYSFARLRYPLRRLWFGMMLATIMLPHHAVIVPQYIVFSKLDWVNTYYPLIVPKFLAVDAFFVFLMVQFIRSLPRELDEAAQVDGCGYFSTYWRIVLPLTSPALVTTAIFTFIWTWNDFFTPLVYLTDPSRFTVPLALQSFVESTSQSAWGALFAMAVLSLGPVLGFFLAAQKYLINGVATTGLKG